ncbi:MAG: hypothetical protein CGU28_03810 [Candidatus Dactylopiibacterium carminicum]|nr:MAG: hypothetical protein CGU28_03810 [Candidatus Dactylopiibacterium carminicum]
MVSLVIASLLTIAVASYEGHKRTTTSVNDLNQSGNYAAWVLDNLLRSAGSGFAQTAEFAFGCQLLVAKGGETILPRAAALPAPFAGLDTTFRLAPVLIVQDGSTPTDSGSGSDLLLVMSGAAGKAEAPAYLSDYPDSASLPLKNTRAFAASDVLLLVDQETGSSGTVPCMLTQVSSSFAESGASILPLAGSYHQASIAAQSLAAYTEQTVALNLGNPGKGNPPGFAVLGVGDNSTLYTYDLLQTSSAPRQAIASGVFELHALYGLDTDDDGKIDSWRRPEGDYAYAALTAGTSAAASVITRIKAVRVGLILRTDLKEKETVSPDSLTLFSDLGSDLAYSPSLGTDNTRYRYRVQEFTVPLRNLMLLE